MRLRLIVTQGHGHNAKLWIVPVPFDCGDPQHFAYGLGMQPSPDPSQTTTPAAIQRFYDAIGTDLDDLRRCGRLTAADALTAATGHHFNAAGVPHYFTGDVMANFVLIHLNAKQRDDFAERYVGQVPTLDEYLDSHAHFGRDNYGPSSPRTHRSPFDLKQIRFLEAFRSIDFVPNDVPDARFINLERVWRPEVPT